LVPALLLLALGLVLLGACSDERVGKKIGETCLTHDECASGLCTISTVPDDGGRKEGGATYHKVCTEPSL
jgi:hypothetical protein